MTDREGVIALNMISGIGHKRYTALVRAFGSAGAVRRATRSELLEVKGVGADLAEKIIGFDWDGELTRELSIAERGGVRIFTLDDEAYPDILRQLYDPPLCLYVRGKLPVFPKNAIAVVGSRRISKYGEKMAAAIARDAALAGCTVVSGFAYGTDTIAHQAAVDCGGITAAVIGSGLLHVYPKENIPLARAIVENGGAIISEFPFDFPVNRQNFPRRNRLVAGLSQATVVIEAGLESGAMLTAGLAMENGRDVFAVPGRVDNPQAAGCHKLIKEGAGLAENFDDIANALNLGLLPGLEPGETDAAGHCYNPASGGDLSGCTGEIYRCLQQGEAALDELVQLTGRETGEVLSALMKLELSLLVERDEKLNYRLIGGTPPPAEEE